MNYTVTVSSEVLKWLDMWGYRIDDILKCSGYCKQLYELGLKEIDISSHSYGDTEVGIYMESRYGSETEISRTLYFTPKGKPIEISNESFYIEELNRGRGIGFDVVSRQIKHAKRFGFRRIYLSADNHEKSIGWMVWPKMGYDGYLDEGVKLAYTTEIGKRPPKRLSTLLSTTEGRQFWAENKTLMEMHIRLKKGKKTYEAFKKYKKGKKK